MSTAAVTSIYIPPYVRNPSLLPEWLRRERSVLRGIDSGALHSNHLHPHTRDFFRDYGTPADRQLFNHLLERAAVLGHRLLEPVVPIQL